MLNLYKSKQERLMFKDIDLFIKETCKQFGLRDKSKLPSVDQLNHRFKGVNNNNKVLKFMPQDESLANLDLGYEERIYKHGIIAHREFNWHDFFNALIWKLYPKTKIQINSIHFTELEQQISQLRSPIRDVLTLFDECGVIVLANENLLQLIRSHQWQELFVNHRKDWLNGNIKVFTFGHAMFEKYMNPYIGMTAKALLLPPSIIDIDDYLSSELNNLKLLRKKSDLYPLPMLGIPEWYEQQSSDFYANKTYFR